jgi:nucleoid DNA-binding protein
MTSGQAEDAIRVFGELVTRAVADGHTVELPAFGKFELGKRGNGEPALRFVQSNSVREALKS